MITYFKSLLLLAYLCTQIYAKQLYIDGNFQVHETKDTIQDQGIVAFCEFIDAQQTTGWHFLNTFTYGDFSDLDQARAAGVCEGAITQPLIYDAYINYVNSVMNGNPDYNNETVNFMNDQLNWMRSTSERRNKSLYWQQVGAMVAQLEGMYAGYNGTVYSENRTDQYLDFDHFYYLTNMGDLEDIANAFQNDKIKHFKECDCFIKLTPNDLITAQATFNIYSLMLRIYKSFYFQFHNPKVRSQNFSFSSRPGDLNSKDDFYVLQQNLTVVESSLDNWNKTNYDFLHYDSVPCWARVIIASRMAKNAKSWARYFGRQRSGTHNNQWFVVDYNKYRKGKQHNLVWLVEESFYLYKTEDVTQNLLFNNSFVAGYNVAYNQEIYDRAEYAQNYHYNYWTDPRAILFGTYNSTATDVDTTKTLIRLNKNITKDPCNAIAPRCDLSNTGAYTFGQIDSKVIGNQMMEDQKVWLVSCPTWQDQGPDFPPFDWRNFESVAHRGMPDVWNYTWLLWNLQGFSQMDEGPMQIME